MRWFRSITFDHDHEFCVEELFPEFLMVEMKSFRFPSFFGTFIEHVAIKCHKEFHPEYEHFPPGREKKSESFWLEWLKGKKEWYFVCCRIQRIEWSEKLIHEIRLIAVCMFCKGEVPSILESDTRNDRSTRFKIRYSHSVIHDLELSEFCIEFWLKGLHHRLVSWEGIGKFSPAIGESEDKVLVFEKFRYAFEKTSELFSRRESRVIDAY